MSAKKRRPIRRPATAPSRSERPPSRWESAAPLAAVAVALALYAPTLLFQFLNWDDNTYVQNNPWIRSLSAENLRLVFSKPYFGNFLPLHLLSYMVDYRLWGLNPLGYHLQSILLHALNVWLGFLVTRRMLGGRTVPFLTALFFAVHPAHLEAVAWISIRKDLLSTGFALTSVYFYLRATEARSVGAIPYFGSVLAFALALFSKVSTVTLPLFLLALDRIKPKGATLRHWGTDLANKIPYLFLGMWLVRLNSEAQTKARAAYAHDALSYAMVKGHAAWEYLGLLLGALRGSPDYDLPGLGRDPGTALISIAGLVLLPAAAWAAYRYRDRALALGFAWIFITLIPALAFPLVTYMADRYLYLPSLGFCWVLAVTIVRIGEQIAKGRSRTLAITAMSLVPLLTFVGRSVQNLPVWRDSESLWTYAMTRCRDFRVYTNLADVRLGQNRLEEAEQLLKTAAAVDNPTTFQNLGVLYFRQGRYPESLAAVDRALVILRRQRWDPVQASVLYYNRGSIYARLGDTTRTIEALEASVRENPAYGLARAQLGRFKAKPSAP